LPVLALPRVAILGDRPKTRDGKARRIGGGVSTHARCTDLIFLVADAHQCVYTERLIRLPLTNSSLSLAFLARGVQTMDVSSLEKTKQALQRTPITMLPLQPKEFQQLEDARWARQDPDVLVQYLGEFVVPYQRKIVAHGKDAAVVLAEAAQITGRPAEELPLVGVVDPLLDMPR
jgi:hypothetical protein